MASRARSSSSRVNTSRRVSKKLSAIQDADIRSFFDEIHHDVLLRLVRGRVSDRQVLKLIGQWLHAGVMEERSMRTATAATPQGGVISPLLDGGTGA